MATLSPPPTVTPAAAAPPGSASPADPPHPVQTMGLPVGDAASSSRPPPQSYVLGIPLQWTMLVEEQLVDGIERWGGESFFGASSMTEGRAKYFLLRSYEGRIFRVDEAVALQSRLVSRLAEDLKEAVGVIRLSFIDAETLEKVLEWCEKHTPANKDAAHPDVLRKWEDDYVVDCASSTGFLDRLIAATKYMHIPELLDRLAASQPPVRFYRLMSAQGQVFEVTEDVALQSQLLAQLVKTAGDGVIPMKGIDTASLRKVIEWCEMHTPSQKAIISPSKLRKWEDEYVVDFLNVCYHFLGAVIDMEVKELKDWLDERMRTAYSKSMHPLSHLLSQARADMCRDYGRIDFEALDSLASAYNKKMRAAERIELDHESYLRNL